MTPVVAAQPTHEPFAARLASFGYDVNGPPSYAVATGEVESFVVTRRNYVTTQRDVRSS
jgi:hypothetical protein